MLLNQIVLPPGTATFRKSEAIHVCWLVSPVVTIRFPEPLLATRSALPAKLALSVRPFGSEDVIVVVQLAVPFAVEGMGAHTPLLDRTSEATEEVRVIDASTLASMGMTMSAAVKVTVAVEDCPTTTDVGESATESEVVSGTTASVPLIDKTV